MSNKILTPDRVHGTMVPSPTGPTLLSHYTIAWLTHTLVERSGGTFVIIIDDLLATLALVTAREPVGERAPDDLRPSVEYWTDELLMCLNHYGLGPSSETELRAQGFNWDFPRDCDRVMGVKWQSDSTLTNHYYEILGFEDDFGPWPLPLGPEQITDSDSLYLATNVGGQPTHVIHPWIVLSWAVDEMSTGRNLAIDGEDLSSIVGQFGEHAFRLYRATKKRWQVPTHYTIPTISGRSLNGTVLPLSSSNCLDIGNQAKECPQILISDAIGAGVDREGLDAYMFEHIIRADRLPGVIPGELYREVLRGDSFSPPTFADAVRSDATIDEADWRRFIKSGQLKPPKKSGGKR